MRYLIFIFVLLSISSFRAQQITEKVYWKDKKLSWSDFKGTKQVSYYLAYTYTEFGYSLAMNNDSATIEVNCYFNPNQSWSSGDTSAYLLNHEQRHFDITEYSSRKFKQAVCDIKFSKKSMVQKEIHQLFDQYYQSNRRLQLAYDEESNHSVNEPMQEVWNNKIDSLLNSTQGGTPNEIVLPIDHLK